MLKRLKNVVPVLSCLFVISHSNSCSFDIKVKQTLRNEGFHRNITYGIVFNSDANRDSWPLRDCIIGLDQTLPPGVYANPDELGDLRRAGKLNVIPKTRINTELPAEQSTSSSVYIIGEVTDDKAYLWMPVHARYHQAVPGGGMARNEIHAPRLFLRCADGRLARCAGAAISFLCNGGSRDQCSWRELPYTLVNNKYSAVP
ncbi:phosphatidylinositol-glycan biosynthesis class X protein-like isoform X1 [Choristoneura fumiferana]|uniref:phosphatidylinositol-glycan biosynthesis class X protein-like isoform X1 n=1 Tax=Choristoneura fumiferana TaxID=7141 RepID=UPI003D15C00F